MDLRSFSEILAKTQGGIRLRPGCSITKELSGQEVRDIFGYIPSAVAAYGVVITVTPTANERYRITVRMEKRLLYHGEPRFLFFRFPNEFEPSWICFSGPTKRLIQEIYFFLSGALWVMEPQALLISAFNDFHRTPFRRIHE